MRQDHVPFANVNWPDETKPAFRKNTRKLCNDDGRYFCWMKGILMTKKAQAKELRMIGSCECDPSRSRRFHKRIVKRAQSTHCNLFWTMMDDLCAIVLSNIFEMRPSGRVMQVLCEQKIHIASLCFSSTFTLRFRSRRVGLGTEPAALRHIHRSQLVLG